MKVLVMLPLLLLMMTFVTHAMAQATCKRSSALTGACSTISGSLGLTRGVGVTLRTDDGKRYLIKAPPGSNADISHGVMQNWLYWQSRTGRMDTRISGRYEVCPLPAQANRAGIADFACINGGSHITADKSPPDASD
jgi:hypothetical protein